MQFELTSEIVDQIIFAMENQSDTFLFDTLGSVTVLKDEAVPEAEETGEGRYISIPEWNSFLGFQLMERFVASLNNPVYRAALKDALQSGTGVFRNFKNVLKESREIERLWFHFKEKEMRREVTEWYERLCESWGCSVTEADLENIEETENLVLEDFVITGNPGGRLWVLQQFDQQAFLETHVEVGREKGLTAYAGERALLPPMDSSGSVVRMAEDPGGEVVGFIWGVKDSLSSGRIVQLFVLPQMRGLGLASVLLDAGLEALKSEGIGKVSFGLYGPGMKFADHCRRQGFRIVQYELSLDVTSWDSV